MGTTVCLIALLLLIIGLYSLVVGAVLPPFRYPHNLAAAWKTSLREFVRYMLTAVTAVIGCMLFPDGVQAAAIKYLADSGDERYYTDSAVDFSGIMLAELPSLAFLFALVLAASYVLRGLLTLIRKTAKN